MSLTRLFLLWIAYSFIGWLFESAYCTFIEKKFVFRGFLNGPIIPIYGFGAMLVVGAVRGMTDNILLIFIVSILLTSGLEYVTSYVMEQVFRMRWWDYSTQRFNLNGRICLKNSLAFGLLSLVLVYLLHPRLLVLLSSVPESLSYLGTALLFVLVLGDFGLSMFTALRISQKLEDLNAMKVLVQEQFTDYSEVQLKLIAQRMESRLSEFKRLERRMIQSFPTLKLTRLAEKIESIRNEFKL